MHAAVGMPAQGRQGEEPHRSSVGCCEERQTGSRVVPSLKYLKGQGRVALPADRTYTSPSGLAMSLLCDFGLVLTFSLPQCLYSKGLEWKVMGRES